MVRRRPALRFALLFAAGILLASRVFCPPVWMFILTASGVLFCLVLSRNNRQIAASIVLQCSIVVLGILLQTLQRSDFQRRELTSTVANEWVGLFGSIESEPVRQDSRITYVVVTDSIARQEAIVPVSRRIMVVQYLANGEHPSENLLLGRRVKVEGILSPFPFQRNPGEFDYAKYLALQEIEGVVVVKGKHHITGLGNSTVRSLRTYLYTVQHALHQSIDDLHGPRHSSFLKGIVFGYRGEIPADVKQSFIDTGTIHILAVSGSNVAFVAFILYSFFGFLRLSRRIVGVLTILGLVSYMVITGSSPSVVRATIMAIVIICGTLFERKADIYNSISVAALLLLFWNTENLFDVGFQLSFAAVLSIVFFYPRLELLVKRIPEKYEEIKRIDVVFKLFAVSLAAQLGTIPFIVYYFGRISIVSLVANIVVVPMSGLSTFIAAAEIGFSFLSHGIAHLYAAANDFLVWFLLGFVKQAASVSFAYLETWQMSPAVAIAYYAFVLGVFHIHRAHIRTWMLILVLAVGNGVLCADIWSAAHSILRVTCIDVGQGDALLLDFPNGKRMLIDAGPSSRRFDAGARTIVPLLKRKGVARLDYFLITHRHSDHIGGAASVLQSLQIDTLLAASPDSGGGWGKRIFEIAKMRNVWIKILNTGQQIQIDDRVRLYVLNPSAGEAKEETHNNTSIVLKVVYGGSSILLEGDAEAAVEKRMAARYGVFLASDAFKAGHHGSASSTCEEFIGTVRPRTAIISVGTNNGFGHPSRSTLQMLARHSIDVHRTDKSGAVILESDGIRWKHREWQQEL